MASKLPDEFQNLPPVLSTTEVAKLLGMTRAGISNLLKNDDLKGFRVGRSWRIHREDFLKCVDLKQNSEDK